jgi:hypothetical protein
VKSLSFVRTVEARRGASNRHLRRARFEARSSLPISAACVVANGVRETLSALIGSPVVLRLFEPSIPSPQAWQTIKKDARLYRVRGNVADAAIVIRPLGAAALVAALFGETRDCAMTVRALSPIERDVLDRLAGAIAANLGALCGTREAHPVERVGDVEGFETYFDLLLEEPIHAGVGIALSRDPSPEPRGSIDVAHLAGIKIAARASLDLGAVDAAAIAGLSIGIVIPLEPAALQHCRLTASGRAIARGNCGVRNGRYALTVQALLTAL